MNFNFSLSPTRARATSPRPSSPLQYYPPNPHPQPQPQDHPLTHLIISQGLSSTETRKFIAVDSIHEAASTLFNELANGYSIVFAGTMFKSEFDNRMRHGRAYQMCRSLNELRGWLVVAGPSPVFNPGDRPRDKDGSGLGTAGSRVASGSSVSSWIGAGVRDKDKDKDRERERDRDREKEKEREKEKKMKEGVTLVDESRRHLGIFC